MNYGTKQDRKFHGTKKKSPKYLIKKRMHSKLFAKTLQTDIDYC